MRKLFLAMATVALLLASCSKNDAATNSPDAGAEQIVTFDVSSLELDTRYGEGEQATTLEWYVYADNGIGLTYIQDLSGSKTFSKKTNVNIRMIIGRTYHILFWAHADGAPYTIDPSSATMKVEYDKLTANKESYDAFYNYIEMTVSPSTKGGVVELRRPFAQLNVATADTSYAEAAGYLLDKTGIEVTTYSTMNFRNGRVSDEITATFNIDTKATGKVEIAGKEYNIISMNYLLIEEKELPNVTLNMQEADGLETLTRKYNAVNVKRNHRTYILGNIFTQPANFTVEIWEDFNPGDHNYEQNK